MSEGVQTVACVAWRFWLGALSNKGGRGQRNREEIGATQAIQTVGATSGRKNVLSMRELFCPDLLAGFEKMAGFQTFYCLKIKCFHS